MQQLVRVHFAQAVQKVHEHVADQALRHLVLLHLDLLLQRAPALVAHHHVDGLVGAEEIQHPDDVGMVDLGERAPFLEKALHPVAERGEVLDRACADDVALGAQHQRRRQVLLDRDRGAGLVERAIDDRKAAAADLPVDPVVQQLVSADEGLVGDGHDRGACAKQLGDDARNSRANQRAPQLAPKRDTAYILRMNPRKVKPEKMPQFRPQTPMILSMTGFAAVASDLPGVSLAVELRSVNHRYLDLQLRLPDELRGLRSRRCGSASPPS